ncbi:MAG: AAA family ATPase, partial [Campylobacterota bacterium]|nr:AAA family ATPase [Campylobacterota bacterium]
TENKDIMMELISTLLYYSTLFQSSPVPNYRRSIYDTISFSHKLVGLKGAKGAGKTTLLQQYLQSLDMDVNEKIYISMDNPLIGATRLLSLAEEFQKRGIRVLVVDEIHYQRNFEQDLKTIYDFFDIQIVFSGSSAIALSGADLSRRALVYTIPTLSFREYLELKLDIKLETISFDSLLSSHTQYAFDIVSKLKPLKYFESYLDFGAYPFFLEGTEQDYVMKLTTAINKTIESDLLQLFSIDPKNIALLKKLLVIMCENPPGDMNITSLAREMELNVKTLYHYISALEKGKLIRLLYYNKKGNALFQKPDKVLLDNPSLFKILCLSSNRGSKRESFFLSMLDTHQIRYSKKGDYFVEDHLFEIGGKNKSFSQIKDLADSYLVIDDIEIGDGRKIPLWIFGFLY